MTMLKALLASLIATLLVACTPTAETGSAPPEHRVGDTPIPQGSAGPCDSGIPGKTCGTYPTSTRLTASPIGHRTTFGGNGDGGYLFYDGGPGGGFPPPGTSGQVLMSNATPASTWNTITGDVAITASGATTVSKINGTSFALPVSAANGGLGAAQTCTSAQVPIWQSSTSAACETLSGDCTTSATGVVTCTQLQAGEITAGATTGTLTCATGATACGITQSSTSSATPTSMVDVPQVSTAASNQVGSSRGVQLSIPTGTALDGSFFVLRGSTNKIFSVGGDQISGSGGSYTNLCLFPAGGSTAACTDTNVTVQTSNQLVFINTPTGAIGLGVAGGYMLKANNNTSEISTASGYNLSVGALTGSYGGGTNVLQLANGTLPSNPGSVTLSANTGSFYVTPATSSPQFAVTSVATAVAGTLEESGSLPGSCPSGNACFGLDSVNLAVRGAGGTETRIAPTGDAFSYITYSDVIRTGSIAAAGGTGNVTWPVPIGYVCWMHVTVVGNYSAGTAGTMADVYAGFRNLSGTVSKVGVLGSATNPIKNLGISGSIADTHFNTASSGPIEAASLSAVGANVQITVTNQASATAQAFEVFVEAKCSNG